MERDVIGNLVFNLENNSTFSCPLILSLKLNFKFSIFPSYLSADNNESIFLLSTISGIHFHITLLYATCFNCLQARETFPISSFEFKYETIISSSSKHNGNSA